MQTGADGRPYLAFEPSTGEQSSYSNSLFTLDLLPEATLAEAKTLANHVNRLLAGVSTTVF